MSKETNNLLAASTDALKSLTQEPYIPPGSSSEQQAEIEIALLLAQSRDEAKFEVNEDVKLAKELWRKKYRASFLRKKAAVYAKYNLIMPRVEQLRNEIDKTETRLKTLRDELDALQGVCKHPITAHGVCISCHHLIMGPQAKAQ